MKKQIRFHYEKHTMMHAHFFYEHWTHMQFKAQLTAGISLEVDQTSAWALEQWS